MMAVGCMEACLGLGLFSTMFNGHVMQITTTSAPSADGEGLLLLELREIKQAVLNSGQSSCSVLESPEFVAITNKLKTLETTLKATETRLAATETQQKATETELHSTRALFQSIKGGSTFVRWGRKACVNSTQLVYSGVAGGSATNHPGGAANLLCLTLAPQTDSTAVPPFYAYLYGAEYDSIPNHHDQDVPCSVCRAAQSTTIMIPATHACPAGWTPQYTGHLVAGHFTHRAASEYVCLDRDPENASSGHRSEAGRLVYYTVTQCGTLPCPPYTSHQVVLCVVCSK